MFLQRDFRDVRETKCNLEVSARVCRGARGYGEPNGLDRLLPCPVRAYLEVTPDGRLRAGRSATSRHGA